MLQVGNARNTVGAEQPEAAGRLSGRSPSQASFLSFPAGRDLRPLRTRGRSCRVWGRR